MKCWLNSNYPFVNSSIVFLHPNYHISHTQKNVKMHSVITSGLQSEKDSGFKTLLTTWRSGKLLREKDFIKLAIFLFDWINTEFADLVKINSFCISKNANHNFALCLIFFSQHLLIWRQQLFHKRLFSSEALLVLISYTLFNSEYTMGLRGSYLRLLAWLFGFSEYYNNFCHRSHSKSQTGSFWWKITPTRHTVIIASEWSHRGLSLCSHCNEW